MTEISCPKCNLIFGVADDGYDQEGTYTFRCPECGRKQSVHVVGEVEWIEEVEEQLNISDRELYEQYCEMKADFKREEGY